MLPFRTKMTSYFFYSPGTKTFPVKMKNKQLDIESEYKEFHISTPLSLTHIKVYTLQQTEKLEE